MTLKNKEKMNQVCREMSRPILLEIGSQHLLNYLKKKSLLFSYEIVYLVLPKYCQSFLRNVLKDSASTKASC